MCPGSSGVTPSKKGKVHLHGWFAIDKPIGMTSTQVVSRVRRLTSSFKAGHGGTLDPLASGILPIALGEATKTVSFVVDSRKHYRFTIRWGQRRDTDDAEGRVVERRDLRPSADDINRALPKFIGRIMQKPPNYSAVKVGGKRAYDLARQAKPLDLKPRPILIERLRLIEVLDADHASFELECGKGGYVRALARDLAVELGTAGYVSALRRTKVGPFTMDKAISLAELEALNDSASFSGRLLPLIEGLAGVPNLVIDAEQAGRLRNGQGVPLANRSVSRDGLDLAETAVLCAVLGTRPVALVRFQKGKICPARVFNYSH